MISSWCPRLFFSHKWHSFDYNSILFLICIISGVPKKCNGFKNSDRSYFKLIVEQSFSLNLERLFSILIYFSEFLVTWLQI